MIDNTIPPLIFVTGLSGAGMSSALKILEDIGYEVFDNFPLSLLPALLEQQPENPQPIAIGVDSRGRQFDPMQLLGTIETLRGQGNFQVKTIFMQADDAVLLKRFTETRRKHPMARDRSIADGVAAEKALLFPLKHQSGYVIDTSELSIHDLRRTIEGFAGGLKQGKLNITLMSFAYRHGLPREADLVFDVRFLRNPNWVADLKDKTGLTQDVQDYVKADDAYAPFMVGIKSMMDILLPRYREEGKSYLTIAFGCTGGRHRSVTAAEEMYLWLKEGGWQVGLHHREIKSEKP
jgi:UPF0042 nucleotide-binding protein